MARVVTTDGTTLAATVKGTDQRLTNEQAEARCKEANDQAEALGIKTRYRVES